MISASSLEGIISESLGDRVISEFSKDYILTRPQATEDSVREVYVFLRSKGLKDEKIASRADLLS